jgi:shikimate dehydrogenase
MPILTGHARLAGIAGWPVSHSRSPLIHGFWLRRHEIDGAYVPLAIKPEDFSAAIHGLRAAGFAGINVTLPHKIAALEICDALDDAARRAGAVNTLIFRNDRIEGTNTDGYGFVENLRDNQVDPTTGPALILGAGGAARAVVAALQAQSVPVAVANRTRTRAEALARDLPELRVLDWANRGDALADHAMLVNTTSLGMTGQPELEIPLNRAPPHLVVADLVYVPLETPLLAAARARGLHAVDGLGMLLHQARPGFAAWFGTDPAVDVELRRFAAADFGA